MFLTSIQSKVKASPFAKLLLVVGVSAVVAGDALAGCPSTNTYVLKDNPGTDWNKVASYPNNRQKMVIASDSQAFRYRDDIVNGKDDKIDAKGWNARTQVYDAIKKERQENYHVPVIVNGDITEFGHGGERAAAARMFRRMDGKVNGPLILPGLGNHDYQNNVGDCANNGCARDMVCDLVSWVGDINPKHSFDHRYNDKDQTHTGSLAYSVDVGNVHVVQLNQEPTYTPKFETGGGLTGHPKRKFTITSAMPWLEKDLAAAQKAGKTIIVNMHKYGNWQQSSVMSGEFKNLLAKYNVTAVFVGHTHNNLGKKNNIGSVPVFYSGALHRDTYLRVHFDWTKRQMEVESISPKASERKTEIVKIPTQPS